MKLIESTLVEIVITHIFMEPMNGYELIQNIREKEEYKKIPIIAVTESDRASRKKALEAGADDLIYRPFISSILHNRVKGLLFDGFDLNRYQLAYENNPIPFIFEPEINKWLDWSIYPDGSGLVAAMVHDITGEITKQTETAENTAREAIRERNAISQIVENIPGGIFVFQLSENDIMIIEANSSGCKLLDVDPVKVIGVHKNTILLFVHPEDQKVVLDAMQELLMPEHNAFYKCRILNRSKNDYVWFSAQAHSKLQSDGNVFAFINYIDISTEIELTETKTELLVSQKANREKTDFLSRVSHDMLNRDGTMI